MALGCSDTLARDNFKQEAPTSSVKSSYSTLRVMSQAQSLKNKQASDLSAAASSLPIQSDGYIQYQGPAPLNAQPSIYNSIIDRSVSASRPASPVQVTTSTIGDLNTAAGHHHGHAHGKYYEYREVPKKKTWKFGYKRGNHKHTISRHEHGKAGKHPHFKTKVKWHDKKSKGKGIHLWDYNHHDKKHYHHG